MRCVVDEGVVFDFQHHFHEEFAVRVGLRDFCDALLLAGRVSVGLLIGLFFGLDPGTLFLEFGLLF